MNTPTPWKVNGINGLEGSNGEKVSIYGLPISMSVTPNLKAKANAELIVRAVNYHDRLVELVQKLSDKLGYSLSNSASVMGVKFTPTDNSLIKSAQQLLTEIEKSK